MDLHGDPYMIRYSIVVSSCLSIPSIHPRITPMTSEGGQRHGPKRHTNFKNRRR